MEKFNFLLDGQVVPEHIDIIKDSEVVIRQIQYALKNAQRIRVFFPSKKWESAASALVKVMKYQEHFVIAVDALLPESLNRSFLDSDDTIIVYEINKVESVFRASAIFWDKDDSLVFVKIPPAIYRLYTRRYFRLHLSREDNIYIVFNSGPEANKKVPLAVISGGGIAFLTNEKYESFFSTENPSAHYEITLFLDERTIKTEIELKNFVPSKSRFAKLTVGAEFISLDQRSVDFISRFVHKKQLLERTKKQNIE